MGAVISDGEDFHCKTIKIGEIVCSNEGEDIESWANQIVVMSSGTSEEFKMCVYDGECFYYQLLDSAEIIKSCKAIKKHYNGSLKQLMFLPLYHIFGLAAMFMWFAFFTRTFVLLKDQSPETILMTIRKHNVTHIFAVPLFWETVYKKFQRTLEQQDKKTISKANKGLKLVSKLKSKWLGRKLFKPIRDKIFGESICFLISGGSAISNEILTFFNSIGYPLANGYGMSEIGIASVELSSKFKDLTDGAVGRPFSHYEYKIDESGVLFVRGSSMAKEIYINGKKEDMVDGWFNTKDIARVCKGRYYICGRSDDVIIGADGENINPAIIEKQIIIDDVEDICILNFKGQPTLLISVTKFKALQNLDKIMLRAKEELSRLGIAGVVQNIEFTKEPLIQGNDFKINRKKLEKIKLIEKETQRVKEELTNEIIDRLKRLFADAIGKSENDISNEAHFFFELGGSSLDYFSLLSSVREEFGVEINQSENDNLNTVMDFFRLIQK